MRRYFNSLYPALNHLQFFFLQRLSIGKRKEAREKDVRVSFSSSFWLHFRWTKPERERLPKNFLLLSLPAAQRVVTEHIKRCIFELQEKDLVSQR